MCGILGGNNPKWDYAGAIRKIGHRGPDGQKITKINDMYLGFARLSIIDLSEKAMQPMSSADGKYAIVFNGEIYDFNKIRKKLESKGYRFRTKSDTEVVLYAFAEWKENFVDYIDGIFAIAVMDIEEGKLYLFRDRAGVKPLYYFYDGTSFAFASELKAITHMCRNISFKIDNTALYDFHTYLYIPEPKTMYRNIYKLEAASCLVFDCNRKKIVTNRRYWKIRLNTREGNKLTGKQLDDKAGQLRYHLDRVIRRQIVSDVPVGTFLSGGVDSSIVTAVTKNYMEDVTAYTIGFSDKRYDESRYASEIAEILGVKSKVKKFLLEDYEKLYRMLPEMYDEPFGDTSAYPTYFVSELAKQDVTVVLTGDGGDELFGGYPRCTFAKDVLDQRKYRSNRRVSDLYLRNEQYLCRGGIDMGNFLKEDLALLAPRYQYSKKPDRMWLREKFHIAKDYDDFWYYRKYYHRDLPPFTRMRYLDFMTYMPGDILTKVDRTSMKVSLEARVPFLDREMIDFAFSLTENECNPNGELKGLLKYAYQQVIPRKMLDRQKAGFSVPYSYMRRQVCPQEVLLHDLWNL